MRAALQTWRLSTTECEFLRAEHQVVFPFPLAIGSTGDTMTDHQRVLDQAKASLTGRGLLSRKGRLDADLDGALTLGATAPTTIDLYGYQGANAATAPANTARAVTAISSTVAVTLSQASGGELVVIVDRPDDAHDRLLSGLAKFTPGTIPAVDVPATDLARASKPGYTGSSLVRTDREHAIIVAQRLLGADLSGACHISVTTRDSAGRTHRAIATHWIMIPRFGSYIAYHDDTADLGHTWLRIRPATPNTITHRIHAVQAGLPTMNNSR